MIKKLSSITSIMVLLNGCSAIMLRPNAQNVIISPDKPNTSLCHFVGTVTGTQGNFFTGPWTSNANLETGAMNDQKNKASELGANYVQLVTNRASQTISGSSSSFGSSISGEQTGVVQVGNAYFCKEK